MAYKFTETNYGKTALLPDKETTDTALMSKETTDALMHHGVIGMKWGVRRYQDYGEGGYNPKHKGKFKPQSKRESAQTRASRMTDEELDRAIKRVKKEQEYVKLSSNSVIDGKEFLTAVAVASATLFLTTVATEGAGKTGKAVVALAAKSKLPKDVFKAIYPKK